MVIPAPRLSPQKMPKLACRVIGDEHLPPNRLKYDDRLLVADYEGRRPLHDCKLLELKVPGAMVVMCIVNVSVELVQWV